MVLSIAIPLVCLCFFQERVLWTNHITRVRPVQCPWYPLVQSTDWHDSAWDVAISERLQLLLDQRVGDELRGLRKIAPAVQGYGAVLTELCDLDRVIVLFCLRLKLDMATTPDGDESEASARDDKALAHFRTGLALLPLAMQGVDWTSPLQVSKPSRPEPEPENEPYPHAYY